MFVTQQTRTLWQCHFWSCVCQI